MYPEHWLKQAETQPEKGANKPNPARERREKKLETLTMLQIRLSKIGSSDSGAAATGSAAAAGAYAAVGAAAALGGGIPESVTVACPDHLVIADLPVAKSLGAVTTSAAAAPRSIGRRSRRPLGERVHICSRCEFPIAIYGRLVRTC